MLQGILSDLVGGTKPNRLRAPFSSQSKPKASHAAPCMHVLSDEVLDGFSLSDIACRACSGFGNCGFKQYFLETDGNGAVSVCMMARKQMQCKRDGIPFSIDLV